MQIRKGGAWRTITSGQVFINGAWRTISNGQTFVSNRWRDTCNFTAASTPTPIPTPTGTMTLAVSPASSVASSASPTIVSAAITATPIGGRSPYTYLWTASSLSGDVLTLTNPTGATTAVSATLGAGAIAGGTISCVCTDSTGLTATSASVHISLIRTGGGIPL